MNRQSSRRCLFFDLLKGIGISYLVLLHLIIWLYAGGDGVVSQLRSESFNALWDAGVFLTNRLAFIGLLLPLLAGITFYLSCFTKKPSFKSVARRSLFLASAGYLMNGMTWGWTNLLSWDVLQFVALATLISYPLLKYLSFPARAVLLLLLSLPCLYFSGSFPFASLRDAYWYFAVFGDIRGSHYWPLCPWFSLFALGILMGELYLRHRKSVFNLLPAPGIMLMLAAARQNAFFPAIQKENIWGASVFKPSPFMVLGLMGTALTVLPLLAWILGKIPRLRSLLARSFVLTLGQGILWTYLVSTVAGFHITKFIAGRVTMTLFSSAVWLLLIYSLVIALCCYLIRYLHADKTIIYSEDTA
ncbi:MAG: DUF1624 domain-containing protein [Candidatus Omnitrophica bacterium]|nr:DUF1624 domain-containing protein [Candidatus Omnitrophota bacterium]